MNWLALQSIWTEMLAMCELLTEVKPSSPAPIDQVRSQLTTWRFRYPAYCQNLPSKLINLSS